MKVGLFIGSGPRQVVTKDSHGVGAAAGTASDRQIVDVFLIGAAPMSGGKRHEFSRPRHAGVDTGEDIIFLYSSHRRYGMRVNMKCSSGSTAQAGGVRRWSCVRFRGMRRLLVIVLSVQLPKRPEGDKLVSLFSSPPP